MYPSEVRRRPLGGNQASKTRQQETSAPSNIHFHRQYQPVVIRGYIFDYCKNTTVHGMKYIAELGRHWSERVLWSLLCAMAASGSMYLSVMNWRRFADSPTVSVIETTNFPVSNIPFPSVTLCDANRVHWQKALQFQERYLQGVSNETLRIFHTFLEAMASVDFGDFDVIQLKFNHTFVNVPELSRVNVSQLMLSVMPKCNEMFSVEKCWWRNNYHNCCDIFELQRTEYGYCYSFNSEVSEVSTGVRKWFDGSAYYLRSPAASGDTETEEEDLRPRRTNSYGPWGGLRFKLAVSNDTPPHSDIRPGIIIMVNSPCDFPENGRIVPAGQTLWADVDAKVTYTLEHVRRLDLDDRDCLYKDEGDNMGLGGYLFQNCMTECHLNYTVQYCNCTPYFFYSYRGNASSCDMAGYLCLAKHNLVFNYHKPDKDNPFFDARTEGMECVCKPDCSFPQYTTAMSLSPLTEGVDEEVDLRNILLDIHFQNPAIVRYRTDVAYSWLDLVVAFGGIAGLCLGCSLLSGAELFYYLTIRFYRHYRQLYRRNTPSNRNQINSRKKTLFSIRQHNSVQRFSPRTSKILPSVWS